MPHQHPISGRSVHLSGPHDIFICHDQASAAVVKRLSAALASRGASSFSCEAQPGASLHPKLATSKSFLVWATEDFFRSRQCQAHLAMSFMSSTQGHPGGLSRILVINAEPTLKHIYPLILRQRVIAQAPGLPEGPDLGDLADAIKDTVDAIQGTLGEHYPQFTQGWIEPFTQLIEEPSHFAGRERELWDLHLALTTPPDHTNDCGPAVAILSGAQGLGKSLMVREYAFRFGPSYPGGIFRLSGAEALPALKLQELRENPALKLQLLALLRQLDGDQPMDESTDLATLRRTAGMILARHSKPFLWIVDDLPDGINGPALMQWLAPPSHHPSAARGATILISKSQRYDQRGEAIHLPALDERAGFMALSRGREPGRSDERDALAWLLDEAGRHPYFTAMMAAKAEDHGRHRKTVFTWLAQKLSRKSKPASALAEKLQPDLPESRESVCALILMDTLSELTGGARDLMRLAAELAEHPIPLEFIRECLLLGGLSQDDRREDLFTIFLNEPEETPLNHETATRYVAEGAESLARHALALMTEDSLEVSRFAKLIFNQVIPPSPRQTLLREAALQALYVAAESSHQRGDWGQLAALAPHGRQLISDLRERAIDPEDSAAEITGRIRLALHLADLDLLHGAKSRALSLFRGASAYLIRAMAMDPHNPARQRDFARVQEQLGDLLFENQEPLTALDHYRKSLGIRTFMAKQDALGEERIIDPLRLNVKISKLQRALNDPESALQTQQAAHSFYRQLAERSKDNPTLQFDIASSHVQMAELQIELHDALNAMRELENALPLFEELAEKHPEQITYARAPAKVHNRIGDILHGRDDLSGALNRYRTGLNLAEEVVRLQSEDPELQRDLAIAHNNIGEILQGLDDSAEAVAHFTAFLDIASQPAHQPAFQGMRSRDVAAVHIKLGRLSESEKAYQQALETYLTARSMIEKLAIEYPEHQILREDLHWLRHKISRITERLEADQRRMARNNPTSGHSL